MVLAAFAVALSEIKVLPRLNIFLSLCIVCIYICIWIMAVIPNFSWIRDSMWYGYFDECKVGDNSCLLQKINVNSFSMVLVKDGTIFVAIFSNVLILIYGNFGLQ